MAATSDAEQLISWGVDGHALALDVPVDEHPAPAVAQVPLGEDVLVERAEVRRVAGHGGRAGAPDGLRPGCERRVGDLDRDGPGHFGGQVAAAHVPDVVLTVAVLAAARDRADACVGAVGIDGQQQPFREDVGGTCGCWVGRT
jgi:hypothetical protein